ncbi:MAG TPA: M14 family zinc carboxypeptidase [Thermoanaerobaculia bacterium]|nr:M14 family zinc carboxypeptidase [Thermoanaerobaculia bacterium]
MKPWFTSVIVLAVTTVALAQPSATPPTPESYLGYKIGERFTPHHRILGYFEELARTSPLLSIERYGETYEGRDLTYAVITSPANRSKLEEIRKRSVEITRPDLTSPERAREIARTGPVIVWLAFGVHGNESSSSEASLLVARRLLENDPEMASILERSVIIIDPLENPDGRERYINWFRGARGSNPNPSREASEHQEPWPGGRFNHYMVDMNRDWAWQSQRETRARVDAYMHWNPQVLVDFHEMSPESTYFFPPDADPVNANLPTAIQPWLERFGKANAEAFGKNGWPFFVKETYDLFYPGYGDSWPALRGSIGMTYEMAGGGRAGSVYEREDGTQVTLADRALRHFTTALATVRTATEGREDLILYTYNGLRSAMLEGKTTYLLLPDSPSFNHLIQTLTRQGIEVGTLKDATSLKVSALDSDRSETRQFLPGTAVISTGQPLGALVQALLERSPLLTKAFIDYQRERVNEDEPDQFYDVTSWSLPIASNVETYVLKNAGKLPVDRWVAPTPATSVRSARFGYLIRGTDPRVYHAAGLMLQSKVKFSVTTETFRIEGGEFPRGTLLVMRQNNNAQIDTVLNSILVTSGAQALPIDNAWSGDTSFGSSRFQFVKEPKIALVSGSATGATAFGALWYTLDIDTPIPHTVIRSDRMESIDLNRFNVIVMPDGGGYGDAWKKSTVDKLTAWVRNGGTIVAVSGAAAFLRSKDVELSKVKEWSEPKKKDDEPVTDSRYNDFRISGAALRTRMNQRSYLTFGLTRPPAVMIEGSKALLALPHRVDNVITVEETNPVVSGFAFPESIERIKGSLYLGDEKIGRGSIVTFADEPHFRLFWRGTLPIFLNAVLYSPSFR